MKLYKDTDSELHSSTAFDVKKASNEQELEKLMATFDNTLLFMDKLKSQITLLSTKTSIEDVEHKSQLMKDMKWKLYKHLQSLDLEIFTKFMILHESKHGIQSLMNITRRGYSTTFFLHDKMDLIIKQITMESLEKEKTLIPLFPFATTYKPESLPSEQFKYMRY